MSSQRHSFIRNSIYLLIISSLGNSFIGGPAARSCLSRRVQTEESLSTAPIRWNRVSFWRETGWTGWASKAAPMAGKMRAFFSLS